jgi:3-polyprenyl-4-hydroxybenzoate decarboxylase
LRSNLVLEAQPKSEGPFVNHKGTYFKSIGAVLL